MGDKSFVENPGITIQMVDAAVLKTAAAQDAMHFVAFFQ